MASKKTVLITLAIGLLFFVVLPATLIVLVDPCHVFHRPLEGIFHHGFNSNGRCQNAGLINNYLGDPTQEIDTILLGTSLSSNFRPEYIQEKLHGRKALKLAFPGMSPFEQKVIMLRAFSVSPPKRVILEVFPQQFRLFGNESLETVSNTNTFPVYLYNNGRVDDYRYIFNQTQTLETIRFFSLGDFHNINSIDRIDYLDHQCNSEESCRPFYTESDIEEIRKNYRHSHFFHLSPDEISNIDFSAADRYLLSTILDYCNQDIQFDLVFPPLSFLSYTYHSQQEFDYRLYFLRYVVGKTQHCKNISSFAFNNEQWISGDLAHYHDHLHFYGGVHDYIIDSIAQGKHQITVSNVTEFEKKFIDNVNHYVPWARPASQPTDNTY